MGINDRRSVTLVTHSLRNIYLRKVALREAKNGYYPNDDPVRVEIVVEGPSHGLLPILPFVIDAFSAIRGPLIVDYRQIVSLSVQSRQAKKAKITVRCSELDTREVAS